MARKNPLLVLLTDFGATDSYVAAMKGMIYTKHPLARIVDLSHDVEPHNIDEAAFLLWNAYKYFPEGTIFVVVVDPDVGSQRRIICVQTARYTFLVPDNGILKFIIGESQVRGVYDVTKPRIFSHAISQTFHGRDIFAPIAALLARGEKLSLFGRPAHVTSPIETFVSVDEGIQGVYKGKVIHIDRFGSIMTNILLPEAPLPPFQVKIEKKKITRQAQFYAEMKKGDLFIIRGSTRLLEISVRHGSAARALKVSTGASVTLEILPIAEPPREGS